MSAWEEHLEERLREYVARQTRRLRGERSGGRGADSSLGLSSRAMGDRQVEPYMAASSALMVSVVGFTALGYGLDRWLGHAVPWLLLVGAAIGMGIGFAAFFGRIAAATRATGRRSTGRR